ncbi:LacI family DNA-binding transcriptional regulator [Sphaerochaeta sp.]|uniref:LacI family DNA-binding transcriptional regulator n=1 Tax=Sphaerochaeta sp. TaxID=1972642 RepID=UPI002FCC4089
MKAVSEEHMAIGQPTIYDVAKKAKVSTATVSRVLNAPSLVQVETRRRVLGAIEELNFVPRADAVAKARRQYKRIGVIAPFFTEPSFMERLKGISRVLSSQHYELVIYAVQSSEELQGYLDMLCTSKRLDGLISLCMHLDASLVEKLSLGDLPLCCVETSAEGCDAVVIDNQEGGRMAARFLYACGCRIPGFIGEKSTLHFTVHSTEERLEGYTAYFKEKSIGIEDSHLWLGENDRQLAAKAILAMLKHPQRPDCIFTSSDTLAIQVIQCAAHLGITIPEELNVVGFDDIEMARFVNLSTVDQRLVASGEMAAQTLLDRLRNPGRPVCTKVIELKLSERGSTAQHRP